MIPAPQLIGEFCGGIAAAVGFLIFRQKKQNRILLFKLICDVLRGLAFPAFAKNSMPKNKIV